MSETTPENEAAVCEIVREAVTAGTPLEIAGGGTRLAVGRPVQAARRVSLGAMRGVSLYEPGELTLVAGAGMPLSEIDDLLDGENQQLTFEPPDYRALLGSEGAPTLGGAVASAASGPRRLRMGACRDSLLGIRFVNGSGEALRSGGRVMKNVTGYDITRLMCGAYGTLGILTEISLKTMPKSEMVRTLALSGLSDADGVKALSDALRTPTDVSGAAHLPASVSRELGFAESVSLLRVEGFETQANFRTDLLREALAHHGAVETIASDPWAAIRDVMMFAGDDRAVWRLSVKPADGPKLVAALAEQIDLEAFYDWGGGLIWLAVEAGASAEADTVRAHLAAFGGHATLMRAPDAVRAAVPVFEPEPPAIAALSAGLKREFDPAGILNPGRMRG